MQRGTQVPAVPTGVPRQWQEAAAAVPHAVGGYRYRVHWQPSWQQAEDLLGHDAARAWVDSTPTPISAGDIYLVTPLPIAGLAAEGARLAVWTTADGGIHSLRFYQEGRPELRVFNHPFYLVPVEGGPRMRGAEE